MKKTTKVLLTLALAFFISGAALGIASLSAGFSYHEFAQNVEAGRFNLVGPGKWTGEMLSGLGETTQGGNTFEQDYTGVEALKLKAGRADCEIIPYDGAQWKVKGEHLPSRFRCELDGEELCVDCSETHLSFLRLPGSAAKLQLYVPRDQVLNEVDIEAGAGTITMAGSEDFLRCEQLDLECGVGEIDLRADIREEAKLEGGVGKIRMTLAGDEDDFNYKVEYGVGSVTIDGERHSGLGGDYKVDNGAKKNLKAECGVGSVEVLFEKDAASVSPGHHADVDEAAASDHHEEGSEGFSSDHYEAENAALTQEHHEEEEHSDD